MAQQVPWNEKIYTEFCKLGMLTTTEREVLRMRIMGYSVVQTSMELCLSEATIHRTVAKLKAKYDKVQPLSDKLPPRRFSAKETWMDEN